MAGQRYVTWIVMHVTCGAVQLVRCGMAGQWYVTWIVMQLSLALTAQHGAQV